MTILNIKLDNILSFDDFSINFSYPQKLKRTLLKNEYLNEIPSFRYKKMNLFLGTNASGKTSLLRSIWYTLLFIKRKEKNKLENILNENIDDAFIEMDFVDLYDNIYYLYRLKIKITKNDNAKEIKDVNIAYNRIKLSNTSSYESLVNKLDNLDYEYKDYLEALNEFEINLGWYVAMPATESMFDKVIFNKHNENEEKEFLKIMNIVFKTLDPSITDITKSNDSDDAYVIKHDTVGKIIIQNGDSLNNLDKLSSGTKYGFNITNIIYSIKNHNNGLYFIDEQFSYVNSDIEKAFISLIATLVSDDEQVFITTRNPDVLELNFPFHSFYFMNKIKVFDEMKIVCSCASEAENRNNVSAKTILDNDYFGVCPNIEDIMNLGENNV